MQGVTRSRLAIGALAIASIVGLSCGDGDDTTPANGVAPAAVAYDDLPPHVRQPIVRSIAALQRAFVARDYRRFCDWVMPQAAHAAGEAAHGTATTCERDVRRLFGLIRAGGGWRHAGEPRVVGIRLSKDTAVATVAVDRDWEADIALARKGERWRMNGFFGAPPERAQRMAETLDKQTVPAAEPASISGGDHAPCPDLSKSAYPEIRGGCTMRFSHATAPIVVRTALGEFDLSRCSASYTIRTDSSGRAWTEDFDVEGSQTSACGDIGACYSYSHLDAAPWPSRISLENGDLTHRMRICIQTCVGDFTGELAVRLEPDAKGWRAQPLDGGGQTGFQFGGQFRSDADVEIEPAGS